MQVVYEQLSGHRVGWKKALHYLTEHFSGGTKIGKQANQPIVLLIDELDLLMTRNQSVIIHFRINKLFILPIGLYQEINKKLAFSYYNLFSYHLTLAFFYQVLYNILDWPTKPNSNLVVIGN